MKVFAIETIAVALNVSRKTAFRRAEKGRWPRHQVAGQAHFQLPAEIAAQCRKFGAAVEVVDPKQTDRQLMRATLVFALRAARKTFPHLSLEACADRVIEEFDYPRTSQASLLRWFWLVADAGAAALLHPRKAHVISDLVGNAKEAQ